MALNIKQPEVEKLARLLANQTGETITETVLIALKERILREQGRRISRLDWRKNCCLSASAVRHCRIWIHVHSMIFWVMTSRDCLAKKGANVVIDTSAIIAILLGEPEAQKFIIKIESDRFAWRKYGKGSHPAGLNFGDCFAYALAKISQEPLLFKGNDFSATDLKLVAFKHD